MISRCPAHKDGEHANAGVGRQIFLQFDVNDNMRKPYMNNSHRCARSRTSTCSACRSTVAAATIMPYPTLPSRDVK